MNTNKNELNRIKTLLPLGKKQKIAWLVITIFIVVFHKAIDALFEITIYKYLLQYVSANWFVDLFIGAGVILIISFYLKNTTRTYVPSTNLTIGIMVFACYYLYQRIASDYWELLSFSFYPKLYYSDIILLVAILQFILFIVQEDKLEEKKGATCILEQKKYDGFMIDVPIENPELDELDFGKYAEQIAHRIRKTNSDVAFAIGITGKWGAGKTSYMNILKKKIGKEDIISIDFSAWRTKDSNSLIKDFLDTLQLKLSTNHSSIERLINHYSEKLTESNSSIWLTALKRGRQMVMNTDSIDGLADQINKAILQIGKKVVVYIDDLDRSDKAEVFEVLRLIRNTANFSNTFYVVAYDRNYVTNALNELGIYNGHEYLEKIIHHEISIPYVSERSLKEMLVEELLKWLPEDLHEEIKKATENRYPVETDAIKALLRKPRDISRVVNCLSLNIDKLGGNVDVQDFVYLELLKLQYPTIHRVIYEKRDLFFLEKTINRFSVGERYVLKKESTNGVPSHVQSLMNDNGKTLLEIHLNGNMSNLCLAEDDINVILPIVKALFSEGHNIDSDRYNPLRVNNPKSFQRYFVYRLFSNELNLVEFQNARKGELSEFKEQIKNWVELGIERDISSQFKRIIQFEDRADFEKVISAIFYFSSLPARYGFYKISSPIGFEPSHLIRTINSVANDRKIYQHKEELRLFISELLNSLEPSRIFGSIFTSDSRTAKEPLEFFTKDELIQFNLHFLKKWNEENDYYNDEVWRYFWDCHVDIEKGTEKYIIHEQAKRLMIDFMKTKDTLNFLKSLVDIEIRDQYLRIRPATLSIFDTWENFEKELKSLPHDKKKEILPFKDFYEACKKTGFDNYLKDKKYEDFFYE